MRKPAGDKEPFLGLTKKAMELDKAMSAVFSEFIIQRSPDKFSVSEHAADAVQKRFQDLWKARGQTLSILKTAIISVLAESPLSFDELLSVLMGEGEIKDLRSHDLEVAVQEMLKGDLLTRNPKEAWIVNREDPQ